MSYAIVGFGEIGQVLAHAFARKNIDVTVASRRAPEALRNGTVAAVPPLPPPGVGPLDGHLLACRRYAFSCPKSGTPRIPFFTFPQSEPSTLIPQPPGSFSLSRRQRIENSVSDLQIPLGIPLPALSSGPFRFRIADNQAAPDIQHHAPL